MEKPCQVCGRFDNFKTVTIAGTPVDICLFCKSIRAKQSVKVPPTGTYFCRNGCQHIAEQNYVPMIQGFILCPKCNKGTTAKQMKIYMVKL